MGAVLTANLEWRNVAYWTTLRSLDLLISLDNVMAVADDEVRNRMNIRL